jgi:hypothetical protein
MSKRTTRPLAVHTFSGPRFENGARLDITVLSELVAYRRLVVECAKQIWRRENPQRERLPRNYEDSIVLSFSRIDSGSVSVPIDREIQTGEQLNLLTRTDEVDAAVTMLTDAIAACAVEEPLPQKFPTAVLPLFAAYGGSLREGESFAVSSVQSGRRAVYTSQVRERLSSWAPTEYQDELTIVGSVTMANVEPRRFVVAFGEDARHVEAPFEPHHEEIILSALSRHRSAQIEVQGRGTFGYGGLLTKIDRVHVVRILLDESEGPSGRSIADAFRRIMADIPREELAKIPPSDRIDEEVYGV